MPITQPLRWLAALLLGPRGPERSRYVPAAVALVAFLLFAVVQHGGVLLGLIDRTDSYRSTAINISGSLIFFLLIRTGLSRRLSSDPSLTWPQSLFAMGAICWAYAITGPARGGVISILILVILFGMFVLEPKVARRLAAAGLLMLVAVMVWRVFLAPERYDPRVELVHFICAAIVTSAAASLSIQLGRLRANLAARKDELEAALAINRELATRDALTGLLNRRAMSELLVREHPRIERGHGPVSLGLLDIDWFKRINDAHGHQAGDAVLQRFSAVLSNGLRAADALARWGGEEFLLLMPGTSVSEARIAIDRLRERMAKEDLTHIAPGLKVSFSAGVVQCGDGESHESAVDRADQALYRAKASGRDRVEAG